MSHISFLFHKDEGVLYGLEAQTSLFVTLLIPIRVSHFQLEKRVWSGLLDFPQKKTIDLRMRKRRMKEREQEMRGEEKNEIGKSKSVPSYA